MARIYENLADTFGNTPLVKIAAARKGPPRDAAREDGVVQSRRLREGSHRRRDDRGRRARRAAAARA